MNTRQVLQLFMTALLTLSAAIVSIFILIPVVIEAKQSADPTYQSLAFAELYCVIRAWLALPVDFAIRWAIKWIFDP